MNTALYDFFRRPGFSVTLRCTQCVGKLYRGGQFLAQYRAA